jgi:phosphohistidine phosphatase
MKTLLLLRHGHSSVDDRLPDPERPLSGQGRRDVKRLAGLLRRLGLKPDLVASSPARRALETAELAAAGCGYTGKIRLEPRLYEADSEQYLQVLRGLPARCRCVLLVGHNPGIRQAAAALISCPPEAVRFAPAALACLEAPSVAATLRPGSFTILWLASPEVFGAFRQGPSPQATQDR